jgi:NAD(P)-dependent dehydrogenase (short-subunit alcohol dehydrogenase family)
MQGQPPSIVVITGASAGAGRATALEFARHGCRIGLIARAEEGLEEAAREVEAAGGQALALPADTADAKAVEEAADHVEAHFGPIDTWVNCAMVTVYSPVSEMTAEEYRRVTEVTYLGYVHGTLAALKHMRPRDRGTIVQAGSALAYRAIPLQSAYCAAKFAIRGFTDSLRSELLHDKSHIRLSMVQLPGMNTPQFDWGRNHLSQRTQPVPPIYQPEVAARAIYRAAVEAPRELWVGKATLQTIVGATLAPGLLDRFLAKKAYSGQETQAPAIPDKDDNLFDPVHSAKSHSAHGRFDEKAKPRAMEVKEETVRTAAVTAVAGLAVGAAVSGVRRLMR